MTFRVLETFKADFKRLSANIQQQAEKALHLLEQNPRTPSLRIKRIQGTRDIWEGRVTRGYRFTFNWESDVITLRRVGTHDLLKKQRW